MIPIYICDDDAVMCDMMKNCLEKQILMGGYDMKIAVCARQPEKLLEAMDGEAEQGIYFLDVDLKGASMDGFRLGQEIRRRDGRGFLIYVTAFPDLAFETFRYHLEALDYIVKGDQEETAAQVIRCLRVIGERVSREKGRSRRYFTVKAGDVVRHIPLEDILYFVTSGSNAQDRASWGPGAAGFYREYSGTGTGTGSALSPVSQSVSGQQ